MTEIHQTAGRDALGKFAPQFAHFNDDVLFGENWANDDISQKTRSIITISVFIGRGLVDSSLKYHLMTAKKNGVTRKEIAAIITHAAFYAGWPVAWAAFNLAKEVWKDETLQDEKDAYAQSMIFPIGESMMPLQNTLQARATSLKLLRIRSQFITLRLNLALLTIGMSTRQPRAAVKC